jgi:hypothetical protein
MLYVHYKNVCKQTLIIRYLVNRITLLKSYCIGSSLTNERHSVNKFTD